MRIFLIMLMGVLLSSALAAEPAPVDPQNSLYLDLAAGRVVIRMRPDLAPQHVARITHLVRGGFYDGSPFHRVIEGFMAQTGDPTGKGTSGSGRKLNAEFTRTPQVRGVVAMARGPDKNSADSQWFIVLADSRAALDGKYTVWGEVTQGMEAVDKIRKGDSSRDGKVGNPDRIIKLQVAADVDGVAAESVVDGPAAQNFSGSEFRCTALGRKGSHAQSELAKLWAYGFAAGYAKAQNKLTFVDGVPDSDLVDVCQANPEAFLFPTTAQELAKAEHALPTATKIFSPAQFTCNDYTTARANKNAQADYADLWAFAFIQGFKNLSQPDMEIPFDARPKLLGPLANACVKNPTTEFVALAALVAEKVKLK